MRRALWIVIGLLILCGCSAKSQLPPVDITLSPSSTTTAPINSGQVVPPSAELAILKSLLGGAGYAQNEQDRNEWIPIGNPDRPTLRISDTNITEARLKGLHCNLSSPRMLTPQQVLIIVSYAYDHNITSGKEMDYLLESKKTGITFSCRRA